jgi:hypothetical protein
VAIIDVPCGQCWAISGKPCERNGKPIKAFHAVRKDRAKRRGVYGIRSSHLNLPGRPAKGKPPETITQRAKRLGL